MASSVQQETSSSLKRRDSTLSRESDVMTITPLGAGSEVGRSCVFMTFKGKTIMVLIICFIFFIVLLCFFRGCDIWVFFFDSLIVEYILRFRVWPRYPILMRLILLLLMCFSLLSKFSVSSILVQFSLVWCSLILEMCLFCIETLSQNII